MRVILGNVQSLAEMNKSFLFFKLTKKNNPGLYVEMAQERLV